MKIHYLNLKGEEKMLDGIVHLQNVDNQTFHALTKSGRELSLHVDRIEGIADMVELSERVEQLESENFSLRARLEKAVELKAKVGDIIYMPWIYDGIFDIASLLITGIYFKNDKFHYITNLESDSAIYLSKYKYGIFQNEDFNNIVFTNCSEAESCLAELKGEKG